MPAKPLIERVTRRGSYVDPRRVVLREMAGHLVVYAWRLKRVLSKAR